ncbi:hypothetical protein [Streptomyces sp. NPDC056144]|uniref:hypothetical protein n=1 Tax=unclassified Streptomyces TaxID=2593676 RepID=UPI0035D9A6F7
MASNEIIRSRRMNSDAKILILLVQGLPESERFEALGRYAEELELKPRQYRNARKYLIEQGYLHEWKYQDETWHWVTDQVLSNVTLTRDGANGVRSAASPSDRFRKVGDGDPREPGDSKPLDEDWGEDDPHPPTPRPEPQPSNEEEGAGEEEPPPAPEPEPAPERPAPDPELAEAERLLLSLRHSHRDLFLGVREARGLAGTAAEWLRRGVPAGELVRALTAYLPADGVRSAVGFLRHRLTAKMPEPVTTARTEYAPEPPPRPAPRALIACEGPGDDHVFRPVADESVCGPCRREAAWQAHEQRYPAQTRGPAPAWIPWRDRVAQCAQDPEPSEGFAFG